MVRVWIKKQTNLEFDELRNEGKIIIKYLSDSRAKFIGEEKKSSRRKKKVKRISININIYLSIAIKLILKSILIPIPINKLLLNQIRNQN